MATRTPSDWDSAHDRQTGGLGNMYQSRYGLRCRPFPTTPDASFYYPSSIHETVLHALVRALAETQGFAAVSGLPGTGKTLVCQCLFERLDSENPSAFVTQSRFANRSALMQAILYELGRPYELTDEQTLRLSLADFLLKSAASGQQCVVVIDEAHHLTPDLLEEIRLLGNLEGGDTKAVQMILVGQPPLLEKLRHPQLRSLAQRIVARMTLEPLGVEESVDYLRHHIRVAGGRPEDIIDDTAAEILARGGRGIPRLLNQSAHHAMYLAHIADMDCVDAEAALEAQSQLGFDTTEATGETVQRMDDGHETAIAKPHRLGIEKAAVETDDEQHVRLFDSARETA